MSSLPSQYQINIHTSQHLSKHRLKTSSHSIHSAKSLRSLTSTRLALQSSWWNRRPLLKDAHFTTLQKGSYYAAIFAMVSNANLYIFIKI